ncbi:MAG TPA: response regulator [Algoriphagus sp.]|jgi:two-component system response regulator (stage 0 sporulation protein F)|uniref:response regulator n=1 Tax=Algoriphagus TaxID=246875 RepID=UPI000C4332AE|nr:MULTISPECIES: response regulator [Algoriphagus]MAL13795.1 response regulator [Algoriphagus sp.]MAN87653.1 response regulator [Algoriphagus sp.]QYH40832.1 response regulator [Algoriphagus sp. NBT04N3]HAD50083.1 response regulator [Algoriphagus sp.]HAH38968.1 response regulator [Algoriphagus sp.]|tara:strand:+ start:1730 stop:2119 length:390 start_codon:yes stop_codon:yes gene_type:complete
MKSKILIVDDEKDVEMLFRQKFRKEIKSGSLELCFAFSGDEALTVLDSEHPPQVVYVFSDINMPGMSGLELLEKIKNRFPQINVSMISAYGDSQNYEKAMSSGAKEFFTKPIDFDSLKKEIGALMSEKN